MITTHAILLAIKRRGHLKLVQMMLRRLTIQFKLTFEHGFISILLGYRIPLDREWALVIDYMLRLIVLMTVLGC